MSELLAQIQDLRREESKIRGEIHKLTLEYVKSCRKFLPEDVRDEIGEQLNEFNLEANGCDCFTDTYECFTDDELVNEYSDLVDGNEEDELLQKALGFQVEYEMLERKTP